MYRFLLFIGLFSIVHGDAQMQLPNYQNMVPPSPEAAAFAKNIDIPMSYSSGTPQIGIPLYSIKSGSIDVPVTLSYNASGIRVDEVPTWVGLGWNLNTGGSLTRSVRGLPDDRQQYGYIHSPANRKVKYVKSLYYSSPELIYINNTLLSDNQVDLEPDIFAFSAMGYSGKFYYNQDSAKFILSPFQNVKIECTSSMIDITEFILTLPNGVKCYFGGNSLANEVFDYSYSTNYVNGSQQAGSYTPIHDYITSWHIKSIVAPTGKTVEYSYTNNPATDFGRGGESYDAVYSASFYRQGFFKPVLESISGELATVYFKRSSVTRADIVDGGKSLDTILIKDKQSRTIKSYLFEYGYFTSPDSILLPGLNNYAGIARKRLYLKSITEKGTNSSLPPYRFTYNDTELPNRLSASQDYWGYYNGKNNGMLLMPKILTQFSADRKIDTNYTQARILKKIQYPTGGTTEYFYESNRVSQSYFDNTSLSGFRFDAPDMVERVQNFIPLINFEPPYDLYYSKTFTVNRPLSQVKVSPSLPPPCTTVPDAGCKYTIKISSLPNNTLISTLTTNTPVNLQLAQGDYKIEAFITGSSNDMPSFSVQLKWDEFPDPYNFLVGGLRVKKIINADSVDNRITRSFNYNNNSGSVSSGKLQGYPVHIMNVYDTLGNYMRAVLYSNSVMPLTPDGQTVLYQTVTEYYDTAQSSYKTEYTFSSDARDLKFNKYDGAPLLTKDWQNHNLVRKRVFEKTATGHRELLDESNFYTSGKPLEHLHGLHGQYLRPYYTATEWWLHDSTSTTTYSYQNGQTSMLQVGSKNNYNDKFLLARIRTANTKGQVMETKIKYPSDYNDVAGFNINTLLQKNILAIPIKQENSINAKLRSGDIIKYNGIGLPVEVYAYENAVLTDTVAHNKNVVAGSNYVLKSNAYYTSDNNLSQVVSTGNEMLAYLWNSSGTYPIAQVKNADTTSVAFTSFETADGTAKWTVNGVSAADNNAITGGRVYSLGGGSVTKSGLNASKTYVVTYWKKEGTGTVSVNSVTPIAGKSANDWRYYEHKIVNPSSGLITVSGTGIIDELRLYPEKALMTSYTYLPLIGITSVSDPNSNISIYEYDDLGRLSLVRDENRNILKKICYNYSGQPVDCGYGNLPAWQPVSSTCELNGQSQNTGNTIITEKDMNPSSSSFNTTRVVTIYNTAACPLPPSCDSSSCTGIDKKCINNICQTGTKVCTSNFREPGGPWEHYYHYQWSDGSISPTYVGSGLCGL